jgi:hypothetical protein
MRSRLVFALTLWPSVYFIFFMALVAVSAASSDGELPMSFGLLTALHLGTMVLGIALLIAFLRHLYVTDRVPQDKRTFWTLALFLGSFVAMPIYWWLFLRPGSAEAAAA